MALWGQAVAELGLVCAREQWAGMSLVSLVAHASQATAGVTAGEDGQGVSEWGDKRGVLGQQRATPADRRGRERGAREARKAGQESWAVLRTIPTKPDEGGREKRHVN